MSKRSENEGPLTFYCVCHVDRDQCRITPYTFSEPLPTTLDNGGGGGGGKYLYICVFKRKKIVTRTHEYSHSTYNVPLVTPLFMCFAFRDHSHQLPLYWLLQNTFDVS